MRNRLCICILLFTALSGSGQTTPKNIDSLLAVFVQGPLYEDRVKAVLQLTEFYQLKNFDSTVFFGEKGLEMARKAGDSTRVGELKRFIGAANYFSGKYDLAARNFLEAVSILEKAHDPGKLAPVYNDLAKLYRKTRDLDKALDNYEKADVIYRQLRDTAGMAMILNESGVVFEYRGDFAAALDRYRRSLSLAEKTGDSLSVSYSLSNLAGVYVIRKDFKNAIDNLQRALRIRAGLKDSFALALTYSDLGTAYNAKGDYLHAVENLTISNRIAEALRYPELQSNNYHELSQAASRQGDHQKALDYFKRRTALRDSLFDIEKTTEIERLSSHYENAQKEELIQEQNKRIRLQNYLMLGIAGVVILVGLLAYSLYTRFRMRKESQLQAELIHQQELAARAILEAEESERQRIARDLHDGVGQMMSAAKMNLSAFESEIPFRSAGQQEAFKKIINLVDDSCREVRTVSHFMMPNALLKNDLGAAIHEFAHKLSHRSLAVQVYTEGLEKRMDSNLETVLYRVVQECVHNAIKHAGASQLDISLIRDADGISGTVEDNGKGFDQVPGAAAEGLGLKNIRTRIEYLKGTVEITSEAGRGTLIAFHIPV